MNQPTVVNMPQAQAADPQVQEYQRLALDDETTAAMEAALAHLQQRVVSLNVEVRVRDARIAELESELAARPVEATPSAPDA